MLDRRNILKFLLAGAAGAMLTPMPWKLLEDSALWTQNWPWIPSGRKGEVTFRRSSSKLCPSGAGMRVQLVNGLPVRLLPDPKHPLSLGGISALALAEIQLLYSPARVRAPLLRGADGILRPVSHQKAMEVFASALRRILARGEPDRVLCLCGDETGSIYEFLSSLLRGLHSGEFYFMPSQLRGAAKGARAVGVDGLPIYRIEDSDFILCLGADILDSWGTVMRNNGLCLAAGAPGKGPAKRLVYCGPARNTTAMAAERWIALAPGSEAIFLLGLANLLRPEGLPPEIAAYAPEKVSAATGVSLRQMRDLARDLAQARRPLVITGGGAGQGGGEALTRLGFAFNQLLGTSALTFTPGPQALLASSGDFAALARQDIYARAIKGGPRPEVLITYDANPVYALPAEAKARLRLADIPLKIAFSSFLDESALAADLVFPLPLGLERLDDIYTPFGSGQIIYSLCPQIVKPAGELRAPGEILLAALATLGLTPRTRDGAPLNSFEDLLRLRAAQLGANYRDLLNGEPFVTAPRELPGESLVAFARDLPGYAAIPRPGELKSPSASGLVFAPLSRLALGVPSTGIPPYSGRLVSEKDLQGDASAALVNAATARRLKLAAGDRVRLFAASGDPSLPALELYARLAIFEGIMDNALGLTLGCGHAAFADFGLSGGGNALDLYSLAPEQRDEPTAGASAAVRGLKLQKA